MILSGRFSTVRSVDDDLTSVVACSSGCCWCTSFLIVVVVILLALNVMVLPKSLIPCESWVAIENEKRESAREDKLPSLVSPARGGASTGAGPPTRSLLLASCSPLSLLSICLLSWCCSSPLPLRSAREVPGFGGVVVTGWCGGETCRALESVGGRLLG